MHDVLPPWDASHSLTAVQELLDSLDSDLKYVIEVEGKLSLDDIENYDEVRAEIAQGLENLRDVPNRRENPLIYHLDVAAMYPNIILTNRCKQGCLCAPSQIGCTSHAEHCCVPAFLGHLSHELSWPLQKLHPTSMILL